MISYYELLGLIKDGKQPDKVRCGGYIYKWNEYSYYCEYDNELLISRFYDKDLVNAYCIEIIIEEKPKKIEKLPIKLDNFTDRYYDTALKVLIEKFEEMRQAVNYLLEEDKHE